MIQTIAYFKSKFINGYIPTANDFADLFDTLIARLPVDPNSLNDTTNRESLNFDQRTLVDATNHLAVNWAGRKLYDSTGAETLDWSNGLTITSGMNGTNGTSGNNGSSGINGINGLNGMNGTNGTSGVSGVAGDAVYLKDAVGGNIVGNGPAKILFSTEIDGQKKSVAWQNRTLMDNTNASTLDWGNGILIKNATNIVKWEIDAESNPNLKIQNGAFLGITNSFLPTSGGTIHTSVDIAPSTGVGDTSLAVMGVPDAWFQVVNSLGIKYFIPMYL